MLGVEVVGKLTQVGQVLVRCTVLHELGSPFLGQTGQLHMIPDKLLHLTLSHGGHQRCGVRFPSLGFGWWCLLQLTAEQCVRGSVQSRPGSCGCRSPARCAAALQSPCTILLMCKTCIPTGTGQQLSTIVSLGGKGPECRHLRTIENHMVVGIPGECNRQLLFPLWVQILPHHNGRGVFMVGTTHKQLHGLRVADHLLHQVIDDDQFLSLFVQHLI